MPPFARVISGSRAPYAASPTLGRLACCLTNRPWLELSGHEWVSDVAALSSTVVFEPKPMTQDFIFAQDVILDPDTGKILAVVRNGGVWRDGAKIAVLVGRGWSSAVLQGMSQKAGSGHRLVDVDWPRWG